jgi:nitrate reductase NapE
MAFAKFDSHGGLVVEDEGASFTKAQELRSFLFLSVVTAPVLAVAIVGGYGFVVWMYQLVAGPPGS